MADKIGSGFGKKYFLFMIDEIVVFHLTYMIFYSYCPDHFSTWIVQIKIDFIHIVND
jgi:hypothetical protein